MLSSRSATVTDGVLKLGYISENFVDLVVKAGATVTCFCHNCWCLPYIMSLANLCVRKHCPSI